MKALREMSKPIKKNYIGNKDPTAKEMQREFPG